MVSFDDRSVRPMFERVSPPDRRGSFQSSKSEDSSISTSSGGADGQAEEESDADADENPDMGQSDHVVGVEDPLHLQTPTTPAADSDEDLPDDPLRLSRGGRRKMHGKNKRGKGKKRQVTYGKKDRNRQGGHLQALESVSTMHLTKAQGPLLGKQQENDGYFIKLGEAIILDWNPEALDALFGGDSNDNEEMRGSWLSTDNGRNLTVFNDIALEELKKKRADRKKNGISLDDCFVETGKREILSEDNAWYCNRCKDLRQAAKTLEIWTLPDILIVHIKRFGGNRNFRDKIDVFVDYPIEGLDMTNKIGLKEDGKEYIYDLFAVDNHYGGLGGGHYTALAKNFYDGQWYDYNDSICSRASERNLHSAAAYLLFYRRRASTPLGPQYLQDLVLQARNPTPAEAAEYEDDGESGEGRLGGPTPSLRGSPSALGAGAGTSERPLNTVNGGVAGAGNLLTQKPRTMTPSDEDEGIDMSEPTFIGPLRPNQMQYGGVQGSQWSFENLTAGQDNEDHATETLLGNMEQDDGNDSVTAEADDDEQFDVMEDDIGPQTCDSSGAAGTNTPMEGVSVDGQDNHDLYSSAHEQQVPALHLEDAGLIDSDSPDAEEIHLEDDVDAHVKMD